MWTRHPILLFLLIPSLLASQIPNFKWSETNSTLSLTFYYDPTKIVRLKNQAKIVLENTDYTPVTKDHSIEQEWLHISWNDFKLDLHLREDINVEESWCKWKDQYVFCSLRKAHDHVFDYLSTRDQIALLKPYGTKDWEATLTGESQDEFEFDDCLEPLTEEIYDSLQSTNKPAIFRAFYPWCGHCQEEQLSFESCVRDKKLKKKKFAMHYVDAREDRTLGRKLNATCDAKCEFIVHYKGKQHIIPGKSKKKDFVEEILFEIEEPYRVIKSQKNFEKRAKKNAVVGGYFEDTQGSAYTKFMEAAKGMKRRKDITYALFPRENPNWAKALTNGADKVLLLDGKRKYTFADFDGDKNFTSWVDVYTSPLFQKYSFDLKKKWENIDLDLPIAKVFLDKDEPGKKLKRKVEKLADQYREKLVFLYYPKSQDHMMAVTGLQRSDKKGFAISTSLKDDNAKHYAFKGEFKATNIASHSAAFLAGELEPTYKTQPDPYANSTWEHGKTLELVQTSWKEQIELPNTNVFVLMYKNWTHNRAPALEALDTISLLLTHEKNTKAASYDYHENFWNFTDFEGKKKHESTMMAYLYSGEIRNRIAFAAAEDKETVWGAELILGWLLEAFETQELQGLDRLQAIQKTFLEFQAEEAERKRLEQAESEESADAPSKKEEL